MVNDGNTCTQINHPHIEGVKFDITFFSFQQLQMLTEEQIAAHERPPFIAESLIVFDKTNQLAVLQERARQAKPLPMLSEDLQMMHFLFYHGNDKVERHLETDPFSALLTMHTTISDFLRISLPTQPALVAQFQTAPPRFTKMGPNACSPFGTVCCDW